MSKIIELGEKLQKAKELGSDLMDDVYNVAKQKNKPKKDYEFIKLIKDLQDKKEGEIVKVDIQTSKYLIEKEIAIIPEEHELIDTDEYDIIKELDQELEKYTHETIIDGLDPLRFKVSQLLALKDRSTATEIIVDHLKSNAIFKTTRVDERNEIWVYKEGIYEPQGRCHIQEHSRKILGKLFTTQLINVITSKIESDTFIEEEKFFNEQNKYPNNIPVLNGVLNIITKEIKPFSPKIAYFNKIPIKYEPGMNCKKFINFLKEITTNEEDIQIIQELFGYCLHKSYKHKKSFMFKGGGDNGKSQLLKILQEKFLGIENTKEISLTQIEKDNFILSELHNKLLNVSADISAEALNDSGNFKSLTGMDNITCNRKFKTTINLLNYAKMVFATNELPMNKDDSKGYWGRWILLDFPHKFLVKKEYDLLNEEEKKNVKIAIPNIIEKIIDEKELSGILNWSLDGFERLEKNKEFSYNKSREETSIIWNREANSVLAFISEHIEEDYDSYIIKNDFKHAYLKYCKEHDLKTKSDKVIKISLENELSAYSSTKLILNQQKYVWKGIKFKEISKVSKVSTQFKPKEVFIKTPLRSNTMPNLPTLPNIFMKEWAESDGTKSHQDLLDVGFTDEKIEEMRKEGVICKPYNDGYKIL